MPAYKRLAEPFSRAVGAIVEIHEGSMAAVAMAKSRPNGMGNCVGFKAVEGTEMERHTSLAARTGGGSNQHERWQRGGMEGHELKF
jgi:hypothetical protein